jgi:hypothetical protein
MVVVFIMASFSLLDQTAYARPVGWVNELEPDVEDPAGDPELVGGLVAVVGPHQDLRERLDRDESSGCPVVGLQLGPAGLTVGVGVPALAGVSERPVAEFVGERTTTLDLRQSRTHQHDPVRRDPPRVPGREVDLVEDEVVECSQFAPGVPHAGGRYGWAPTSLVGLSFACAASQLVDGASVLGVAIVGDRTQVIGLRGAHLSDRRLSPRGRGLVDFAVVRLRLGQHPDQFIHELPLAPVEAVGLARWIPGLFDARREVGQFTKSWHRDPEHVREHLEHVLAGSAVGGLEVLPQCAVVNAVAATACDLPHGQLIDICLVEGV